ncbi:MAG: hypothetical protein KY468_04805 [Armatimonadetes bacterium]|nr:hypothetical protein [Armatimonadota bacterium]
MHTKTSTDLHDAEQAQAVIGDFSLTQLQALAEIAREDEFHRNAGGEGFTLRQIARRLGLPEKAVAPMLSAFRKVNAIAAEEAGKKKTHLDKEILKAYHPPGAGRFDNMRKANGHYDWDRITGLGLAATAR